MLRRKADAALEDPGEVPGIGKAAVGRDLLHRHPRGGKKKERVADPLPGDVLRQGLPRLPPKEAREVLRADLPRGEPRGFAREGFWLGKVLIFHTEVFRVVLTDKPLWDRYLLRSQPSKPLTGQLRADGTLLGSIRSLFQEPGAKSNALLW